MQRILTGFFLAAALSGCADLPAESNIPLPQAGPESATEEVQYLRTADDVAAAFLNGTYELVSTQAFRVLDIRFTLSGRQSMEYQVHANGTWSPWAEVVEFDDEELYRTAILELSEPAQAIRFRGGEGMEFARFEFFSETDPEGTPGFNDDPVGMESHDDDSRPFTEEEKSSRRGRWRAQARAPGNNYSYFPAESCSGGMRPGSVELGQYIVANFPAIRHVSGYNCRSIRGGRGRSVHGTGRALDFMIAEDGGKADNDGGDPVAEWLIQHADEIGLQLIIWDETIWNPSRDNGTEGRAYHGVNKHTNHLHVELTPDGANKRTAWFNGGMARPPAANNPSPPAGGCNSSTLGRTVTSGTCVQTPDSRCGQGDCSWFVCNNGGWACSQGAGSCTESVGHAQCAGPADPPPPAAKRSCTSRTLGRDVADSQCVQMPYDACGGTCQWARCDDGAWSCTPHAQCGEEHPHDRCAAQNAPPVNNAPVGADCYSRTVGGAVQHLDEIQMAYVACGQGNCNWAVCEDGNWACSSTSGNGAGANHQHVRCQ